MTRVFKPQDAAEQTAFAERLCSRCPRLVLGCTILADARPLDPFDADYPSELIYDDDGKPFCTSFMVASLDFTAAPAESLPAVAPVSAAPAVDPQQLEVVSIETTTTVRGLIDALKLKPHRRSWTVPYNDVRELFAPDGEQLLEVLDLQRPTRARVHANRLGVVITARSKRDGKGVSASVRVKFAGGRR